jgi:hypothetical protein
MAAPPQVPCPVCTGSRQAPGGACGACHVTGWVTPERAAEITAQRDAAARRVELREAWLAARAAQVQADAITEAARLKSEAAERLAIAEAEAMTRRARERPLAEADAAVRVQVLAHRIAAGIREDPPAEQYGQGVHSVLRGFPNGTASGWQNVLTYGADPGGIYNSDPAFQAALNIGGVVYAPAGTYILSQTLQAPQAVLLASQGTGIIGDGSASTFMHYTGNAQAINIGLTGAFTGGAYAGTFSGFYLDGYSAGSAGIGMQIGNLQGFNVSDVALYGFNKYGLYFHNTTGYSEQANIQMRIVQCGTAAVFDGSSYDYANYDFTIVSGPGQGGITLQNGAQLSGVYLRIRGNFYGAPVNTSAVIAIDPGNLAGTSYIIDALCDIAVESAGTGQGPFTLLEGSASGASQFTGTGVFSFNPVAIPFQGYSTQGASFSFSGLINDPNIGSTTPGVVGQIVYGELICNDIQVNGNGNLASGNPAMFLNGPSQIWQFFEDNGTHNFGVYDQTHSKLAFTIAPNTELATFYGGTSTAQSAPALTPAFANGTAAQLSDTTRDYMIYLQFGAAGTAMSVAIGPTSTPANTIISGAAVTAGEVIDFRLPAGWFAKISFTTTTLAFQQAIGC